MRTAFLAFAPPLLALFALACQRAHAGGPALELEPIQLPSRSWTSAFQRPAVLVADELFIEGPPDLVDHIALRQDEETTVYATKTVSAGLRQELAARPELGVEVRGQLDAWSLAAVRKITVLIRPGEAPVTVRARGSAFWSAADGSAEKRDDELVFHGPHGR
jgi:hypothetical protein